MASLHVASELVKAITNIIYPVGSIYITNKAGNPSSYLGGTWSQVATSKYLIGYDSSNAWFDKIGNSSGSNGKSGGWNTDNHTLTINEIPKHAHDQYVTANSGTAGVRSDYNSDSNTERYYQCRTGETGGGQGHNHFHVSPYYTVIVWKRTA